MGEWNTGLFGCFSNPAVCCLTMVAPVLLIGKNAEAIGEDGGLWAIVASMTPCGSAWIRTAIRKKRDIDGGFFGDFAVSICCPCCSIAQETIELKSVDYLFENNKVDDQEAAIART